MKLNTDSTINSLLSKLKIRRKYKDHLFQRVFSNKKDLLDLYNAVNHTTYTDVEDLEITTLEDVIYLSMKNDISFMVSSTLNLYEQQSTYNPNMPIRGLMYFAKLYEAHIADMDANIYGRKLIKLPTPQYIVFYNGRENVPDEMELKLSDAFELLKPDEAPALECRAKMYNINYGHNKELLSTCKRLHDYAYFIAEVNSNLDKRYSLKAAIDRAIDTCIRKGILTDILIKCRSEVQSMLLTEFNEKKYRRLMMQEGREEGLEIGREEGREIGREEGREIGREEGQQQLNDLYSTLLNANRMDDMKRAMEDKEYRKKLLAEYEEKK